MEPERDLTPPCGHPSPARRGDCTVCITISGYRGEMVFAFFTSGKKSLQLSITPPPAAPLLMGTADARSESAEQAIGLRRRRRSAAEGVGGEDSPSPRRRTLRLKAIQARF